MEIQDLWRVIRQRWRVISVVTLIFACLSLAWSLARPVSYIAQGRVIISTSGSLGTANDAYSGEQVSVERAPTYAQLLRGPEVAARASQKLRGLISPENIQHSIDARVNSRQPMVIVTATSPRANDAVQIVSAAELGLQQYVLEVERPGRDGSRAWVVLGGDIPTVARAGNPARDVLLAVLIGMVCGTLLAVYRDRTDPIVKSAGQVVAAAGLTYRGTIAADEERSRLRNQFWRLAVGCVVTSEADADKLEVTIDLRLIRSMGTGRILVVGVDPDSETNFIAKGLASGLVSCGSEVTLIDALSRSPGSTGGLSDVVEGRRVWAQCRTRTESDRLWQMDIGTRGDSLTALLIEGKDTKGRLALSSAREHAIIAAPSLVHSHVAVALTAIADAALVVVQQGKSRVSDVVEAKMTLQAMGIRAIGMVLVTGVVPGDRTDDTLGDRADAELCATGVAGIPANPQKG